MGEAFAVGSRVSARGLIWDVLEVASLGAQTLLHLRCASNDLDGLEWDILHPVEQVEPVRSELRPEAPGTLAAWRLYHQACLLDQILGPRDVLLAEPGRLRIEAYQLVPVMRALELPRPRLLLADGVGLGKTVEAGLIICELIARRRAHRVLVVSPAGPLLVQWEQEMRSRFGLRFVAVTDAGALHAQRRRLELGGNPFDAIALCLTSLDFAKQEHVLEELERCTWDLTIIDEAHHCIAGSLSGDVEATQRRRLAEVAARRSDGLLLLTATPHDGYDAHFASLIELLDPSLVDGRGGVAGAAYRRHVVRRLKSHIRDHASGARLFPQRRMLPIRVAISGAALEPVRRFHQALAALIVPRLRRAAEGREHADALSFVSLLKRSVSTISACVNTLCVVADRYRRGGEDNERLRRERARALRAYRVRLLRFGVLDEAAENDIAELEADGMAADLQSFAADELAKATRTDATSEALDVLLQSGRMAEACDPKLAAIQREVHAIRRRHPSANILIYTEYADSQLAALNALRGAVDGEVLAINGLDTERERSRIAERCAEEDGIVVISTDTMAEGLNLQQRCFNLIHLDLPYNPNRLEQRNGRIDRYGQVREPQIRYLYLSGTFEERLLLRLIAKYEKARAHLDFMPDTLGVTANETALNTGLVAGFAERQDLFEDERPEIRLLDSVADELGSDAYRDLLREIDRAFSGFEHSTVRHGWFVEPATIPNVDEPACHIDLPKFVAATIGAETGTVSADGKELNLPADWLAGLDGLPGFDNERQAFRFTRDRTISRDASGSSTAVLGLAHPLVRRACSRALRTPEGGQDNRTSVALATDDLPASVLFTFDIELRSASQTEFRKVIAVLLPSRGAAREIDDPCRWLQLAATGAPSDANIWRGMFADWVPARRPEADVMAAAAMERDATRFLTERRRSSERESAELQNWLRIRADDICGVHVARTGDLFGEDRRGPDWRWLPAPLDRLQAYADDTDIPLTRRREASNAVALFKDRCGRRATLLPPVLRQIGMLMLVPPAIAA